MQWGNLPRAEAAGFSRVTRKEAGPRSRSVVSLEREVVAARVADVPADLPRVRVVIDLERAQLAPDLARLALAEVDGDRLLGRGSRHARAGEGRRRPRHDRGLRVDAAGHRGQPLLDQLLLLHPLAVLAQSRLRRDAQPGRLVGDCG